MDIYEQTISDPLELPQLLFHLHASDADEIPHAQILYEFSSSFSNDLFSLHPYTGELYLISRMNLQSNYEFDIDAYDRHRKDSMNNNNIKTRTHVRLRFSRNASDHRVKTILNQTIEFEEITSSYRISFHPNWNRLNIHQPILTIEIAPMESAFELFILENSSINAMNLFLDQNKIYLNQQAYQEYNLHLLICFSNRTKCQPTKYDLIPRIDLNLYQFRLKTIPTILLDENLPIHSFIANIQLEYNEIDSNDALTINYRLFNNHQDQFHLHSKTGILRLAKPLEYQPYSLDIQADIYLFNQFTSMRTTLKINVREINKHRPVFSNETLTKLVRLPYQFQSYDFDANKQTNGRVTYRLWNCLHYCPFQIHPNTGLLTSRTQEHFLSRRIYHSANYRLRLGGTDWLRDENECDY